MAETMLVAFGRYLRLLRERRGLSLDHVEALTAAYPEPVSKVYLSRVENGHSKIAFSRMIALCRAYEYPIDAASERLWLDLGVDRMDDPPETAGKGARELLREGRQYVQRGFRWHAYACARDAISVARTSPLSEVFRDHAEQAAVAEMNTATAATSLGRYRYALTEYRHLEHSKDLQPKHSALVVLQISTTLRGLGQLDEASRYVDQAIAAASKHDADEYLGECLTSRATIAFARGDLKTAFAYFRSALVRHRDREKQPEVGTALVNLAQVAFALHRIGAARRFLAAANRIAQRLDLKGLRVKVLILSGEIHRAAGDMDGAERCWKEGLRIANGIGDTVLAFKVKYFLYRHAAQSGKLAIASRMQRSLERISPWIPPDTEELRAFREDVAGREQTAS
jgi:tetratricopeptide (TPR) repeat protein